MKVCRTCANSDVNKSPMLKLFDMRIKHLLQYIQIFTGLLLTRQIGMPDYICDTCLQDLERAIKFRKRCIETQKKLSRNYNVNSVRRSKKTVCRAGASVISFPIETIPDCQDEIINDTIEYDNSLTETTVEEESSKVETQNELSHYYGYNSVRTEKTADGTDNSVISFSIERMPECQDESVNIVTDYDNSFTEQDDSFEAESQNELSLNYVVNSGKEIADGTGDSVISFTIERIAECQDELINIIEYDNSSTETTVQEESSEVVQKKFKKRIRIDGPVVCEICGKSFNLVGNFREHQLRHSGIKKFNCHLCTFKFCTNKELVRHMRRHTGERPYACKYCDSHFADLSNRAQHERRHRDERNFKCEGCDKSFVTSDCLKNHMLTHTGQRTHCCSVCNQWFLRRTQLSTHLRSKGHIEKLANQELCKMSDNEKQKEII